MARKTEKGKNLEMSTVGRGIWQEKKFRNVTVGRGICARKLYHGK
ncbi:Uncharacterised protein [Chlamydia abortus]|nr:Uncharacterised protein [Chlamydia abortus]